MKGCFEDMSTEITLTPEDVIAIIAEKFNVNPQEVDVLFRMKDIGYGTNERKVPTFEIQIKGFHV